MIDAFVRLSDTLVDDYDVIDFLTYLTQRCVEFSHADEASVMLAAPGGRLHHIASSTERSRLLELFEVQNDDGPCLDAYRSGEVVAAADLTLEAERWPTFTPEALGVGFRSVYSVPLRLRTDVIGALNLLCVDDGSLSAPDARLVRALADIATIGVLQERTISRSQSMASGLQTALTSRIQIEQAKGILAERVRISIDEAFDRLRTHARQNRLRLTDVAIGVIDRTITL
ncbi:MAG: hypothetical protein JWM34_4618 [Ilumatobacteraceae bacterium]|nr:hypothetical protein [Ilumatobacteraceae bacterium]